MLAHCKREGRSASGCNADWLDALYGALNHIDFRDVAFEQHDVCKRFTADLREAVSCG